MSLFFAINKWLIYTPLSRDFVELETCPTCFGISLCDLFKTKDVQLSGWERFSFFNNDQFNIKNIYHGSLKNQPVIFKKMAHHSEWTSFDICRQNKSCYNHVKTSLTTLLPCSDHLFVSKFRQAFINSTGFDGLVSEISLDTTIEINLEPIVLSALSNSDLPIPFYYENTIESNRFINSTGFDGLESEISLDTTIEINLEPIVLSALSNSDLPIPFYYGACGRVGVFSNEGSNLVSYLQYSFRFR
ncbi:unnamed protein product, partial [Rotaria socialis]